jgi:hypothetical protein
MCEACLEMELYFAYLEEVEAKKQREQRTSQPWQCEATVLPQGDGTSAPAAAAAPAQGKSRFACEEPE